MADISASLVMKLRKMSGQGMMDCKKALGETDGDLDKAMEILRKKGLATLEKRAGRDTSEGKVVSAAAGDGTSAAMASLCCETDFVSKSTDFLSAADALEEYMLACEADEGIEALGETEVNGKKFAEVITDSASKTGEKTELGEYAKFKLDGSGTIGSYVHFNDKIGAMVLIETSSDDAAQAVESVAGDIAMHITAINPVAVDSSSVDPDVVEKEKALAREQMKNKPDNIIDKIIEGKMAKFFAENCLVDQPFVKDDSVTVGQILADTAKKAGGEAKIKRFVRIEIG